LLLALSIPTDPTAGLKISSDAGRSRNDNYLLQGVTTVVTGNDGQGPINVGAMLRKFEQQGIGTNAALLVGQGVVRREVMGMSDGAPTPDQLETHEKASVIAP